MKWRLLQCASKGEEEQGKKQRQMERGVYVKTSQIRSIFSKIFYANSIISYFLSITFITPNNCNNFSLLFLSLHPSFSIHPYHPIVSSGLLLLLLLLLLLCLFDRLKFAAYQANLCSNKISLGKMCVVWVWAHSNVHVHSHSHTKRINRRVFKHTHARTHTHFTRKRRELIELSKCKMFLLKCANWIIFIAFAVYSKWGHQNKTCLVVLVLLLFSMLLLALISLSLHIALAFIGDDVLCICVDLNFWLNIFVLVPFPNQNP